MFHSKNQFSPILKIKQNINLLKEIKYLFLLGGGGRRCKLDPLVSSVTIIKFTKNTQELQLLLSNENLVIV